eukprot:m.203672 g.203672  ORF g.203672 m.203672 type:complete len:241 (+) comp22200_c0_seq1:29-751(+)
MIIARSPVAFVLCATMVLGKVSAQTMDNCRDVCGTSGYCSSSVTDTVEGDHCSVACKGDCNCDAWLMGECSCVSHCESVAFKLAGWAIALIVIFAVCCCCIAPCVMCYFWWERHEEQKYYMSIQSDPPPIIPPKPESQSIQLDPPPIVPRKPKSQYATHRDHRAADYDHVVAEFEDRTARVNGQHVHSATGWEGSWNPQQTQHADGVECATCGQMNYGGEFNLTHFKNCHHCGAPLNTQH